MAAGQLTEYLGVPVVTTDEAVLLDLEVLSRNDRDGIYDLAGAIDNRFDELFRPLVTARRWFEMYETPGYFSHEDTIQYGVGLTEGFNFAIGVFAFVSAVRSGKTEFIDFLSDENNLFYTTQEFLQADQQYASVTSEDVNNYLRTTPSLHKLLHSQLLPISDTYNDMPFNDGYIRGARLAIAVCMCEEVSVRC